MLGYSEKVEIEANRRGDTYLGMTDMKRGKNTCSASIIKCKNNIIRFVVNREYIQNGGRCGCEVCKNDVTTHKDIWENPNKQKLFLKSIGYEIVEPAKTIMKLVYFKTIDGYIGCNSIYCIMKSIKNNTEFEKGIFESKNKYQLQNLHKHIKDNRPDYQLLSNKNSIGCNDSIYIKYNGKGLSKNSCRYFKTSISSFIISDSKHPELTLSKGEVAIANWLTSKKFKFITNYKFKDCRNQRPLKFDFAVFNNRGNLLYLIEFDGAQHEADYGFVSKGSSLEYRQYNDNIKNKYCEYNKISFLRINHRDFKNIPNILEKWNKQISTYSKEVIDQIIKQKIMLINLEMTK